MTPERLKQLCDFAKAGLDIPLSKDEKIDLLTTAVAWRSMLDHLNPLYVKLQTRATDQEAEIARLTVALNTAKAAHRAMGDGVIADLYALTDRVKTEMP